MFWFWGSVMKSSADILEFDHPSRDVRHSIEKKIFIDSLDILNPDTIRVNQIERVDILPTASWIEKMTFWKSGSLRIDSLGTYADTVMLLVNFKDFVNGNTRKPNNNGYKIIEFKNPLGDTESVYMNDNIVQLNYKLHIGQVSDTIRLSTTNGQVIILRKWR